tara:strand:+ start:11764 stop:12246 length:483 start_codon:yes stop_codon:yes gene_type:complete
MIKLLTYLCFLFILSGCNKVEWVLDDKNSNDEYKNNVRLIFNEIEEESFVRELLSFFGNNKNGQYIISAHFLEKKENRLVKSNQVAEKTDYELIANYEVFYKNTNCKILDKEISSKFSFVPKSFGYNFGTDRSFEKLYLRSIKDNILQLNASIPINNDCL